MNAPKSIIRRGRKFDQVLDGAREVFLTQGFEGASVDEIARRAGVSKATLYSYFPDKRLLFAEVARLECERIAEEAMDLVSVPMPVRDMLRLAAHRMTEFFNSDFAVSVFRVCASEAERFPELAQQFYRNGPQLGRERLKFYMSAEVAKGTLAIDDVELAADQFAELCRTRVFVDRIFGIRGAFSKAELARISEAAVDVFLARYGA